MLDKNHAIQSKAHLCYTLTGKKGAGKSALLERMCESFYQLGRVILDVNGAPDLEQLAWCVPNPERPVDEQTAYPILIVIPRSTEILSDGRMIKTKDGRTVKAVETIFDDSPLHQIINQAHFERRVVIFNIYLYDSPSRGQRKLSDLIFGLPNVMRDHVSTDVSLVVAIRELADLSGARMNAHGGTGSRESKRSLNFLSRQIRHFRTSMIVDTQNLNDIYAAFIANQDILLVKNIHRRNIPAEYTWWVQDIEQRLRFGRAHYMMDKMGVVSPERLSTNSFYAIFPDNDYRLMHNAEPSFLHHKPDHDAKALAGIKIKYLSKTEFLDATSTDRILQIQQKTSAKEEKMKQLNDAYQLYKSEKAQNPRVTWYEIAKKANFTGVDGKASGNALRMAIERAADKGKIDGWTKETAPNDAQNG